MFLYGKNGSKVKDTVALQVYLEPGEVQVLLVMISLLVVLSNKV